MDAPKSRSPRPPWQTAGPAIAIAVLAVVGLFVVIDGDDPADTGVADATATATATATTTISSTIDETPTPTATPVETPVGTPAATPSPPPDAEPMLTVSFLDIGQGDATLLQAPDATFLYDTVATIATTCSRTWRRSV